MPCYVWWNYERSIRCADGKCRQFLVILPRASPQISAYCHCFVLNRGVCVSLKIAETSVTSWAVAGKGIATITSIARTSAAKIKEDICRSLFCSHVGGEGNQPRLRKLKIGKGISIWFRRRCWCPCQKVSEKSDKVVSYRVQWEIVEGSLNNQYPSSSKLDASASGTRSPLPQFSQTFAQQPE